MKSSILSQILLILFVAAFIVVGPLITLWTLNTLFPVLQIQYTCWTWLAALFLNTAFYKSTKKD